MNFVKFDITSLNKMLVLIVLIGLKMEAEDNPIWSRYSLSVKMIKTKTHDEALNLRAKCVLEEL